MPKVILNKCNVNISGVWNVGIFSPAWLKTELPEVFSAKEIEIGAAIGPEIQLRFTSNEIVVVPSSRKLVIGLLVYSSENLDKIQLLATKIFEKLPHTPITAIGNNLDFELEENESFASEFNPNPRPEEIEFSKHTFPGMTLGAKINQYVLSMEKGVLNLKTTQSTEARRVEFNFHYEIRNKTMIVDALSSFKSSIELAGRLKEKIIVMGDKK